LTKYLTKLADCLNIELERFFLTGVATVAREAEQTARQIVELREQLRRDAQAADVSVNTLKLMDYLFEQPVINVKAAQQWLGVSFPAGSFPTLASSPMLMRLLPMEPLPNPRSTQTLMIASARKDQHP
jgi:hypothetical protein